MVEWMGTDATLDPRPGGVCRLTMNPAASVLGEFVEVEPYTRIVFTWGYEKRLFAMPPQSSALEVSLTPDGEETVLRLAHRRLPAAATEFHRAGWHHYLPRLAVAAAGGGPGPDALQAAGSAA